MMFLLVIGTLGVIIIIVGAIQGTAGMPSNMIAAQLRQRWNWL